MAACHSQALALGPLFLPLPRQKVRARSDAASSPATIGLGRPVDRRRRRQNSVHGLQSESPDRIVAWLAGRRKSPYRPSLEDYPKAHLHSRVGRIAGPQTTDKSDVERMK